MALGQDKHLRIGRLPSERSILHLTSFRVASHDSGLIQPITAPALSKPLIALRRINDIAGALGPTS